MTLCNPSGCPCSSLPRVLVVSGLSNAGKSTFCRWLESAHNYERVDCDLPDGIDLAGLRPTWALAEAGAATPLAEELGGRARRTVIDWSYPPNSHCLAMVSRLKEAGIAAWWFDADHAAARKSCIDRGQGDVGAFDSQAEAAASLRSQIRALYGVRYLQTLRADGHRLRHDEVLAALAAAPATP